MGRLYEKVGKDNLLELNKLVSDFSSYFGEFQLYQTYNDLKAGINTDDVKFYYECVERRNQLFIKMKEVNFNYMNNNSFSK